GRKFAISYNVFNATTNTFDVILTPARLSATLSLSASPSGTSVFGQPVTFTAVVTPEPGASGPTGTVTFTVDGVSLPEYVKTLSNSQAALTLSNLGVGQHTITATYSGDSGFSPSGPKQVTQTVNKAST